VAGTERSGEEEEEDLRLAAEFIRRMLFVGNCWVRRELRRRAVDIR